MLETSPAITVERLAQAKCKVLAPPDFLGLTSH